MTEYDWRPFPSTAPTDRQIIVSGTWRPFDILPGGGEATAITSWSSYMSDGASGYHWLSIYHWLGEGRGVKETHNVDWAYWTELPRRSPVGPRETITGRQPLPSKEKGWLEP